MKKTLFIVDGPLDRPILHSQGIPLLKRLSQMGVSCYIQSFEPSMVVTQSALAADLAQHNIIWKPIIQNDNISSWQRVSMIINGFLEAYKLCRAENINIVHCRSYRPGVMGALLKLFLGTGFLFDMRGFLIDEQLMLGRWKPNGILYRTARALENWMLLTADITIANSSQFQDAILELSPNMASDSIAIIPNCVDTTRFIYPHPLRDKVRAEMGWTDRFVVMFSGEVRAWEDFDGICNFFEPLKKVYPAAYLALFAYGNLESLHKLLETREINTSDYCVTTTSPDQMPIYLGAADAGIIFRRENQFTKAAPSPIKFGEYLSSGLPVVLNPGIGDTERIVEYHYAGVIIDPQYPEQITSGIESFLKMLTSDTDLHLRCHQAAQQELSLDFAVEQYATAYQRIADKLSNAKKL